MAKIFVAIALLAFVACTSALTDAQARARLNAAGIQIVSSGGCSDRNNPTCTALEGIRENTIAGLETLKKASGCGITMTGGTETGHAGGEFSHANGYKADISRGSCIDGYVKGSFTFIGNRGDGAAMYQSAAGNIYAAEGNHWDIYYK